MPQVAERALAPLILALDPPARMAAAAQALVGAPYRLGGSTADGLDAAGLARLCLEVALGADKVPAWTRRADEEPNWNETARLLRSAGMEARARHEAAQAGDVVVFAAYPAEPSSAVVVEAARPGRGPIVVMARGLKGIELILLSSVGRVVAGLFALPAEVR